MTHTTKRFQCRHIFTQGHRCGSPCLRHEEFCYYHHTTRRPIQDLADRRARQSHFSLAMPEDRAAIQVSIGEVLLRIASNEIDTKRAGLLLYGLQIASLNLPRDPQPTRPSRYGQTRFEGPETALIEDIEADPTLGTLAPPRRTQHHRKKKPNHSRKTPRRARQRRSRSSSRSSPTTRSATRSPPTRSPTTPNPTPNPRPRTHHPPHPRSPVQHLTIRASPRPSAINTTPYARIYMPCGCF